MMGAVARGRPQETPVIETFNHYVANPGPYFAEPRGWEC